MNDNITIKFEEPRNSSHGNSQNNQILETIIIKQEAEDDVEESLDDNWTSICEEERAARMKKKEKSKFDVTWDRKLIKLVEAHPMLWDPAHEMYKKNHKKPSIWKEIAAKLGPQFTGPAVLLRYRSLRDTFNRNYVKMVKTTHMPKWYHFERLLFLKRSCQDFAPNLMSHNHKRPVPEENVDTVSHEFEVEYQSPVETEAESRTNVEVREETSNLDNSSQSINPYTNTVDHSAVEIVPQTKVDAFFKFIALSVAELPEVLQERCMHEMYLVLLKNNKEARK